MTRVYHLFVTQKKKAAPVEEMDIRWNDENHVVYRVKIADELILRASPYKFSQIQWYSGGFHFDVFLDQKKWR